MKHFIYKTTHKNGKYYIGRHSTDNIDDGYLGSGVWIKDMKRTNHVLSREILEFADSFDKLILLEASYLTEHYGKPQCMNMISDSNGFSPETSQRLMKVLKKENRLPAQIAMRKGTHINLTANPSITNSKNGTHHWQHGRSPNAEGKLNKKLISEGKHNFLGPDLNQKRIDEGTHNFLGSDSNLKRLAEGTHPSQQKITCEHCTKTVSSGMYKRWHGDNCQQKSAPKCASL
jgi:ribosomal protein L39E